MRVYPTTCAGWKQFIQVVGITQICEHHEVSTTGVTLGSVCHIKLKNKSPQLQLE